LWSLCASVSCSSLLPVCCHDRLLIQVNFSLHIMYKVVQIWQGLLVCKQVTVCPGHISTTLYLEFLFTPFFWSALAEISRYWHLYICGHICSGNVSHLLILHMWFRLCLCLAAYWSLLIWILCECYGNQQNLMNWYALHVTVGYVASAYVLTHQSFICNFPDFIMLGSK
jgi:hypothetical protein